MAIAAAFACCLCVLPLPRRSRHWCPALLTRSAAAGPLDDSVAPPVANCTAIYGVNMKTCRCMFLKRRPVHHTGGTVSQLQAKFELDPLGDVDGLNVINGVGWETELVHQIQPDTGDLVRLSGDGTVSADCG